MCIAHVKNSRQESYTIERTARCHRTPKKGENRAKYEQLAAPHGGHEVLKIQRCNRVN